jgi:predicted ATPase/DNA-binding CsgD family transcriptional regulator
VERGPAAGALTALPAAPSSLVGREADLRALLERAGDHRLVTVVGPGGIGKTRLALALAHELARDRTRVGFVELVDVVDGRSVLDAIADQLSVEVVAGASRYDGLVHLLGAEQTVLVVDNFEHLIDAVPDLAALLDECVGLHLVVTSRRALGLRDEQLFSLGPLAATAPDGAAAAPGVQLLFERSNVAHPTASDIEAASQIVSGVGGLPLAIELAAFRARSVGVVTVHELLVAELALGGLQGPAGGAERHSNLRACLEWTTRDLDERARSVFHVTGAFAGHFDLAALRSVVGDHREAAVGLATLVEHHLVDRIETDDGSARYTSIPPIREFSRELLAADPECAEIIEAHARRYAAVAAQIRASFENGSAQVAIVAFRRDRANIGRAIETRQRARRYFDAATIACDVAKIAAEIGREGPTCEWFRDLVGRAGQQDVEVPYEAQMWAAYGELITHTPGTAASALGALEAVIERARAAGDDAAVLRGLDRVSFSVVAHGDIARSTAASREGIELADRLGLRRPLAELSLWHAMLLHVAGDIPGACSFGFDALRIARRLGDSSLIVRVGLLFAPMTRTPDMDAEKVPTLGACLETAREHGSVIDEMYVTMQLAVRAGLNNKPDVFELAHRGLELADRTRSHGGELVFLLALAAAAFDRGDDDLAVVLDAALRPEWTALATVMPSTALERYDQVVERRRAAARGRMDRAMRAAGASLWPDVLELARVYAATGGAPPVAVATEGPQLTDREREVLQEISAGSTNKEIALQLGLRPKTVMHHCSSIYRKLGVKTRTEATAVALRAGLLDRDD